MMNVLLILVGANVFFWLWVWVVPTFAFASKWFSKTAQGIAPFPGIVVISSNYLYDKKTLAHELHHQVQMKRFSPVVFAVLYAFQCIAKYIEGKRGWELYHSLPLEIDAFDMMHKPITQRYIKFYR